MDPSRSTRAVGVPGGAVWCRTPAPATLSSIPPDAVGKASRPVVGLGTLAPSGTPMVGRVSSDAATPLRRHARAWPSAPTPAIRQSDGPQPIASARPGPPGSATRVHGPDLFVGEDVAYAERLRAEGVDVTIEVVEGLYHGADGLALNAPQSKLFYASQVDALRAAWGVAAP